MKHMKAIGIAVCGLAMLAGAAWAGQDIPSEWYGDGGASSPYALVSRENEAGFSYTPSPEDWRDRNIYQLFTDRFATDGNNNLASYKPDWFYRNKCTSWGAIPRNFHQGGNWRGLRQQIPYLQGMGVTAVWISGVQLNDQAVRYGGSLEWRWTPYHQYHVDNFFRCEPASGTFQELKDLIDDLHKAGIAVILDVAPNHMCDKCGRQGNNGNDDKSYTDWDDGWWWDSSNTHPAPFNDLARFHLNGTINNWDTSPENLKGQFKGTDDLKQEDGTTSDILYKAFKNLIDATDCDGFRVDAIKHIDYKWCRGWAQAMRDHAAYRGKNNFLVFGELFSFQHDALAGWCSDGYGFNASLDFPLMNAMNNAFGNGYSGYQLGEEMGYISSKYGKSANNVIAFLDNHDVNRFACSYGGGSKASAAAIMRPAMTFLYLAPPIPLLYYGTEHCFNQGGHGNGSNKYGTDNDPFYNPDDSDWQRECMFDPDATWGGDNGFQPGNAYGDMFSDGAKEAGLYYHIAWLNSLRNKSRALRRGGFAQRASVGGQGLYAFTKWYGDEVALVLLNTSDYDYKVSDYNSGWLEVGIQDAVFKENGDGDVVGSSNGSGWIDLSGVTVSGKGTKIFICNFVDNSADVGGSGGGGGGSSLWANSTYVWPTEATSADTIYINTQAGSTNSLQSVKVIYGYKGQEGAWPFEEMELNAEWTPTQDGGAWYHYELPASQVSAGTLQFSICVSDGQNEFWDNNGGGDYLVEILPPAASIGATFGTVSASPSDPKEGESVTITAPMVADEGADTSQLWVKLSFAYATASGSTGTWTTVSMTKGNTYQGTTYFTTSIADLPGGRTLCYKLEAGNGGTDTIWANNGNAYRLKIAGTSTGEPGNCWHCPTNHEAADECMRTPVTPSIGSRMVIRMGNYQGGDGSSAEHDPFDMTGGTLYYRFGSGDTWTSWESSTLYWNCRGGDNNFNNYWTNAPVVVPDGYAGQFFQYYFEVFYTNSEELATTYLYMNPDNSGTSLTTISEAIARETPFEVGIAAAREGTEPGYVWHGGNITRASDTSVQIWAKIGYKPDGGDAWADEAIIRYRIDMKKEGKARSAGVKAVRSTAARAARSWQALTSQTNMTLQSLVADGAGKGQAMMWMGTITDERLADPDAVLIYEVYARNTKGTGFWRQAEYNIADGSCTFEYRMWSDGSGDLTVDGVSADYTTSKFFIDEAKGETVTVEVAYHAPDDADAVELFTNFGRRDYAEVDTDLDGWPDGMIPPAGDSITVDNCADGYWQAIKMDKGAGAYVTELTTGKCGVYRITARYKAAGATNWTWYSENPNGAARRDHVVVISPKKAMEQRMYELNVLTTKATDASNTGSGNFEDLSERLSAGALDGTDPYGEFSLDYLNRMGVNCLWFQPIHPNLGYERGNTNASGARYWPGSPYATKNYFSVSHEMSKDNTEAAAVAAFTNFVRLCDKAQSDAGGEKKVGTINVMLDGVMNHTSFDAVFGEGITLALAGLSDKAKAELTTSLGAGWDSVTATNVIPATKLGINWYSHVVDDTHNQADPATRYVSVDDNDIANAPERYDFGKWNDVAELLYGDYSTMVKFNDMSNVWVDAGNDYWYETTVLGPETSRIYSEEDQYYYGSMRPATKLLWKYMASYPEYWIKKTGNDGVNHPGVTDANGVLTDDYGIDGLRCDYAQGLPNQFWEYTINRTRAMKWNFLFMAESLDGGKVGFRSNRQFDILNENMVFRFTQDHVSDPVTFQTELENRRKSYGNGLILLNETCHDEIIPWGDPQATASRYAMVSAVDGIPMIFYGQEQAISTFVRWWDEASQSWKGNDGYAADDPDNANKWKGFLKFESNFGKWIPHFKTWNKMLVWDEMVYSNNTPNASRDIAAFYGKINLARMNSPALRSKNRWFCYEDMNTKSYCSKIFFCAKWEDEGKSPNEQDAVFAAVLFLNDFESDGQDGHAGAGCTYDISAFASKMGIENRADRFYNVKNIASTNDAYVWTEPKSGKELYEKGFYVLFRGSHANGADLLASEWTDNGNVVQYLKVFDVTGEVPPVAPDGLTINDPAETLEVANGTASYAIVGMAGADVVPGTVIWTNAQAGVGGSFAAATVWTQSVALATGTNVVTFTAESSGAGGTFTVLASEDGIGAVDGFANFTSNCTGTAGMFVHDNVSATDITGFENNHAFGLYANTGGEAQYTRMFDTDSDVLSAGVTLGMRYNNEDGNDHNDKGVQFLDAAGNVIFGVKQGNGEAVRYWYGDVEGTWSTTMGSTSAAFDVVLTKTANGYAVSGTKRDGGDFAGLNIETNAKVAGLKFWMQGVEDDPQYKDYRQLYFNNLTYTVEGGEPETVTATATIIVSDTAKSAPTITVGAVSPAAPTVGQTVTIPVQATGDGNPTLALTDALLDGSTYTGAALADGSLTFVPALSGTYVFTLLATNTSEDGQTATATATVTVAAAVIQIDEIVDCTMSGGKVTVTLKGESLDGLTSVPVWVSDGFKDGDWGWKQYGTASVVDGEVQLKDLQITTDCLMISVGKPSYLP